MSDDWGIFGGDITIDPDSFVGIETKNSCRVSNFPQEKGGFASYNKVEVPNDISVQLAIGSDLGARSDFLDSLFESMKAIGTFTVATPEEVYEDMTLESYSYRRTSESGVTLIVADLLFKEIRIIAGDTTTQRTKAASGASSQSGGQVTAIGDDKI